jgi:hypothetical protein
MSETVKTVAGFRSDAAGMIDIAKASEFMRTNARLLDRRRFELLFAGGRAEAVLAALSGYANPDGGFGYGLEPDLRSASSQPGGALHAFEVLEDIAPETSPVAVRLCDWLGSVSFDDGWLPFAFAIEDGAGSAPFWAGADPSEPSLFITSAVAGAAHRVAGGDPAVAAHPWLESVTEYCLAAIAATTDPPFAIAFHYILQFLDAIHDTRTEAPDELARLGAMLPESGSLPVAGGSEGEKLTPLDISPVPGRPLRELLPPEVVSEELDDLAAAQRPDGGWEVDFASYSAQARLEWRGYRTVWALSVLRANGRLDL